MIYFPGQRVKLVRPYSPENLNIEGFFKDYVDCPKGTLLTGGKTAQLDCNCRVYWDKANGGPPAVQHSDQLEPILPDGMQPASWEDTVWDPERLVEESKELVCIE